MSKNFRARTVKQGKKGLANANSLENEMGGRKKEGREHPSLRAKKEDP